MRVEHLEKEGLFRLTAGNMEYVIGIADEKFVGHVYFGKRIEDNQCGCLMRTEEAPFVPSKNLRDKCSFADAFLAEYSTWGVGDYRDSCLNVRNEKGFGAVSFIMRDIGFWRVSQSCRGCRLPSAGKEIGEPG